MQYFDLIIITKHKIEIKLNLDYKLIFEDFSFIDEHHLKVNDTIFEFNYLIYTKDLNVYYPSDNFILIEDDIPITNFFYQTSLEHIYYINKEDIVNIIIEIINF